MKRPYRTAVAPLLFLAPILLAAVSCDAPEAVVPEGRTGTEPEPTFGFAAPGRVEGRGEILDLGAGIDGIVAAVLVAEGDLVSAGDPLVRLECSDLVAAANAAAAEERAAREAHRRVLRGDRDEDRRVARAETEVARTELRRARERHERMERLSVEGQIVAQDVVDEARRDLDVAEAALRAAEAREQRSDAGPLDEEVLRSAALVRVAVARATEARERSERCEIRAPIAGTILRRGVEPGEQVGLADPSPVIRLADLSVLRVRAEVDERDVGRVRVGQSVLVGAPALGDERIPGHVASVGAMMGRKTVRTGDPAEKADRDVLEVRVDLDRSDPRLVPDLRATVLFLDE